VERVPVQGGEHRFLKLTDPKALPLADLKDLVERSHALVPGGLSKKLQKQLLG
jgi:predicted DNA-binding protein (MmcQ/YjbR family)